MILKRIIILSIFVFLFNINLQAIREEVGVPGRITLGVPFPTQGSTYIPGTGISGFNDLGIPITATGTASKPKVISREAYTNCREKCLLNDEYCLNDCLCTVCWRESIGSQSDLIDYCRCRNPDTTSQIHF